jgi:hypothetical protein
VTPDATERRLAELAVAYELARKLGGWFWRWWVARRFRRELDRLGIAVAEFEASLADMRARGLLD